MANNFFSFKKFTIHHNQCAMKVGTDGVLLGTWTPVEGVEQILDVGTGSGLIAIQLAQRTEHAQITAIEVDAQAASQAAENAQASPWKERIEVICENFEHYTCEKKFDLIVSNPPYFVNALKCPNKQRRTARHTDSNGLSYLSLFRGASQLLAPHGIVSVIIPSEVEQDVLQAAFKYGLYPHRMTQVFTKPNKPCRRVLITFSFTSLEIKRERLCIEHEHLQYTDEYMALTKDFYLHF